jgi:5-methylcytosine-specific restriction endonuclease McrA
MFSILTLDAAGNPRGWVSWQTGITHYAKGQVAWELGDHVFRARGGYQKDGHQSFLSTAPIISIKSGKYSAPERNVPLTNKTLFGRDNFVCGYCGLTFKENSLSRDHIHPRSKGGLDTWMNCISSCKWCNNKKDDRTTEQAGMHLLYLPYKVSFEEKLLLENRNILGDQMEFLKQTLPKNSRQH